MSCCEGKYGFEVEEMNLSLLKSEIKCEGDTEMNNATATKDEVTPIRKNTFEIEGIRFLTPKFEQFEVKREEGISEATSSQTNIPDMAKVNTLTVASGKCPGCRRPFILNLSGFDDIARHIFYSHKKNSRQYLFILRMIYGSPYYYARDQKRIKGFINRALTQYTK